MNYMYKILPTSTLVATDEGILEKEGTMTKDSSS